MKLFKTDAEFAALHTAALIHGDEATIEAFASLKRRRIVAARLRRNLATARARMAAIAAAVEPVGVAVAEVA
jgi:hypothetical protein